MPVNKSRDRRLTGPVAANAIHGLISMALDLKKSIQALRYEVNECWTDLEDLRRMISNCEDDLEDMRQSKRRLYEAGAPVLHR